MPEYLAPGVYVEETSFRAKSIEGVSTSTTGFVGPSRRGPVGEPPELITSFPDFQRIYGGLADLEYGLNYLAHAVRAYFDEGGSRLYVSRAFLAAGDGLASSPNVVDGAGEADRARFVARSPGAALNGTIELRQVAAPATRRTMERAPNGTLVRVGGGSAAEPARLEGTGPTYSVPDGGRLLLTVGGGDDEITFVGTSAEAIGDSPLNDPTTITADDNDELVVTVGAEAQTITLPAGDHGPDELVAEINERIRGGYARLTDAEDPGAPGRLVIGSDRAGAGSSVTVGAHPDLMFAAETTASNAPDADNNVDDLSRVTADEINALLVDAGIDARASLGADDRLVLATTDTGAAATLEVRDADDSVHGILGLPAGEEATGRDGGTVDYYVKEDNRWVDDTDVPLDLSGLDATEAPDGDADFLTLNAVARDLDGSQNLFEEMGFHPDHPRYAGDVMSPTPSRRADALENLYGLEIGTGVSAFELREGIFGSSGERTVTLSGGSDGVEPTQAAYEAALSRFEQIDDISIVAGPGHSAYADATGIQGALISHAEGRRRYRIAVLDTPPELTVGGARTVKSRIDSDYAALYFPWVVVSNPLTRPGVENVPREISLPPSGFVCGIYARSDVERGVHKAPANEVVRGALRFETDVNFAEQEVLNPIGVNCLRFFPGRGHRVWGARTASSDPEWKYVNVRRYFNYLERSIDEGTQWAVFEPNGERLWANIRETVESFLYNEWRNGALLGASQKEAYFVRCDRSTMTQNDIDNGRLVCLVGVAPLRPAEFVIFRIGQKTADARS